MIGLSICHSLLLTGKYHRLRLCDYYLRSRKAIGLILSQSTTRNAHPPRQVLTIGDTYESRVFGLELK